MPRVNTVQKCRKSPGQCTACSETIKKGEPYKFWAFMVGGMGGPKIIRCGKPECAPKPWDLTRSDYLGALYRIQDNPFPGETQDDLESQRDDIAEQLRQLGQEQQDKFDNMPQGLQDGDTGQMLQERAESCESAASELESVDCSVEMEKEEKETDEARDERIKDRVQEIRDELASALDSVQ